LRVPRPRIHLPPRARRVLAPLAAALGVLVLACAGLWLGLRVAGPATYETPLGGIRVDVAPDTHGGLDAYVPLADWGLRARAFDAPLQVRAEVRSIRRDNVLRAATGERKIVSDTRDGLDEVALDALVRAALWAMGGAVVVALVLVLALAAFGRRRRRTLALGFLSVLLTAAAVMAGSALAARLTFDEQAIQNPAFYARGAELGQLLAAATKTQARAKRYSATAENGVRSFSRLLAEGGLDSAGFVPGANERSAILASDLHNNTLALPALESLAGSDKPVFLVGDFGHQGVEGEARLIAPQLAKLGDRVVAVSGNHDSTLLMRRLADVGITVLTSRGRLRPDGTVGGSPIVEVLGMKVAGAADPLEYTGTNASDPDRIFSFSERPNGDEEIDAAGERLVAWFDTLPERPEILLVHNFAVAQRFARTLQARGNTEPLLMLVGHDHKQWVERHGAIVIADAGTVGAGGVFGVGSQKVGLGELHFGDAGLASVDLIKTDPLTGAAEAERVIVEDRECENPDESCKLSD
jgi:predicted phosphodiesterase